MGRLKLSKMVFTNMILIAFCTTVLANSVYATAYTVFEGEKELNNSYEITNQTQEGKEEEEKKKEVNKRMENIVFKGLFFLVAYSLVLAFAEYYKV